jgi:hypothetical protein
MDAGRQSAAASKGFLDGRSAISRSADEVKQ